MRMRARAAEVDGHRNRAWSRLCTRPSGRLACTKTVDQGGACKERAGAGDGGW
jgi:hypothetical protein